MIRLFYNKTVYTLEVTLYVNEGGPSTTLQIQPLTWEWGMTDDTKTDVRWRGITITAVDDNGKSITSETRMIIQEGTALDDALNTLIGYRGLEINSDGDLFRISAFDTYELEHGHPRDSS